MNSKRSPAPARNISVETTVSYFHHNEKLVALGLMRDITEKRQNEWSLRRLISCFTDFSSDSGRNIATIVESIGEILEADCVLYNRKEGDLLVTQHGWKMPESMPRFDSGEGRICFSPLKVTGMSRSGHREPSDVTVFRNRTSCAKIRVSDLSRLSCQAERENGRFFVRSLHAGKRLSENFRSSS